MTPQRPLTVVSNITPDQISIDNDGKPEISQEHKADDALDHFNHPRYRRALILLSLQHTQVSLDDPNVISFAVPHEPAPDLKAYLDVHSSGLIEFLSSAWDTWGALGEAGQDPSGSKSSPSHKVPALIPINTPLGRDHNHRPSKHVIGQMGYYCTDNCTPIFSSLPSELLQDASIVEMAVDTSLNGSVAYALPTHPGHHASRDSFGGYCYVNHAAHAAKGLQSKLNGAKVAILDVDYHCGNGTASIFYQDASILVCSIHCDPDFDYPFHSGFADETGTEEAVGVTLHLPLVPETQWTTYRVALGVALKRIVEDFEAQALVVSLGLDTYEDDPCTIRRAGFKLKGDDYWEMGQTIRAKVGDTPTVFVQEGGYRMDKVGKAAADVVLGFCSP